MILVQIILLIVVVLSALSFILSRPGTPKRSTRAIALSVVPFLILGVICQLILSANGVPFLEWLIPGLGVLAVALWCRSDKLFRIARWSMFLLAVALCANFLEIVQSGYYTAAPRTVRQLVEIKRRSALHQASKALREEHDPKDVLPAGRLGVVESLKIESAWYTPLTRIYRIRHDEAEIWYPGGPVAEAVDQLEIRPAAETTAKSSS